MRVLSFAVLSAALVAGTTAALTPPAAASVEAPLAVPDGGAIAGQYLVVLRAGAAGAGNPDRARRAAEPALGRARSHGVRVRHQFLHALNGYLATLTPAQLAAVRADPAVAYVAQDGRARASAVQTAVPSWGMDRVDQRSGPLDGAYHYDGDGTGVTAYVIDTGIRATHTEYAGRVTAGASFVPGGSATQDCNGHGTHVAGTIGGRTYGVAKAVTLVPVQVLSCDGFGNWSWIIAGIDWVTATHAGPSVANLSLGGGAYQPVDDAVSRSIASGVTYAIAAMNYDQDACDVSPARTPEAITVGATSEGDVRWDWRNGTGSDFGPCLDLFAPGDGIQSASAAGDTASEGRSGTSMATPHVAGAAALYLQQHPSATPAEVAAAILGDATRGVVADAGSGSPDRFLHVGSADTTSTTTTTPAGQPDAHLQAEQRSSDANPTDNAIRPGLQLRNTGSSSVDLSRVTLRYWFTRDGGPAALTTACDYVPLGCGHVRLSVQPLRLTRAGADSYLEVGFDAGSLPPGGTTGELQLRLHKLDWSNFDERDDYSRSTAAAFAASSAVTVYVDGQLVSGVEPGLA